MTRAERRLLLGEAAVLTVAQAAALLPWADPVARRWLRNNGLIRLEALDDPESPGGFYETEIVVWGDVVDRLRTRPAGEAREFTPPPGASLLLLEEL